MTRGRVALSVLVATTTVGGVVGLGVLTEPDDDGPPVIAPALELATVPPAEPTTTTTLPPLPALPPGGIGQGSSGPAVTALKERLRALHYDPGADHDRFDHATEMAVWAFEKVLGFEATGQVDDVLWAALDAGEDPAPLLASGGATRVEVDKVRQVLFAYRDGELVLVTHVSTGSGKRYCEDGRCGVAVTPTGGHRFLWRVAGWRTSRLGRLYQPVYFTTGGVAIHGFPSVPSYPASHGCVRIPMHIAEYFPSLVERGDPVYVFDGAQRVEPLDAPTPDELEDLPDEIDDSLEAPPQGWLDGEPPPSTSTTIPSVLA
jgi:peptidoglycan hydrolase-like protein with peptidoglycan-binding domain